MIHYADILRASRLADTIRRVPSERKARTPAARRRGSVREMDMLCEWCHGKGITEKTSACGTVRVPCQECGGCGILHCCEGLVEQSPPSHPQDVPCRSNAR